MTTGKKLALGCGGLGFLGVLGFVVLTLVLPPPTKEQEAQWHREAELRERGRRQQEAEAERQRQTEQDRQEAIQSRKVEESFLPDGYGRPVTLTQAMFGASRQGTSSWRGKIFPEPQGGPWKVDQIIKGRWGRRYVTYEFSSGTSADYQLENNRFAVDLRGDEELPLTGSFLVPGCFRYEGVFEGENLVGTTVTVPGFRRVEMDHPACRLLTR